MKRLRTVKKGLFLVSLLALPVANYLLFWLYVNIQTVIMTFQRFDIFSGKYVFFGGQRYAEIFRNVFLGADPTMHRAFGNTFHAIAINVIILPLAVITAYAFYKKVYFERFFRIIFFLPSMISPVVLTMAYRYMFYTDMGPVANLFAAMGFAPEWLSTSLDSHTIWPLIYFYCIWTGLSTNVMLMCGAMLRIPTEISESATIDGCGFFRELWSVTLPLIMTTITAFAVLIVTSVFGFTLQPMLIAVNSGENGKALTLPWYIFNSVQGSESNLTDAAAVGIIFSLIMLPIVIVVRFLSEKLTPKVDF